MSEEKVKVTQQELDDMYEVTDEQKPTKKTEKAETKDMYIEYTEEVDEKQEFDF